MNAATRGATPRRVASKDHRSNPDQDLAQPPQSDALRKETVSCPAQPLRDSAYQSICHFLQQLDGEGCSDLYAMVIAQVEEPLLKAVMQHTDGNQSQASVMLGLNRGTLRKKLRDYGLLD